MTDPRAKPPTLSPKFENKNKIKKSYSSSSKAPQIPIDIVSDEEMALIEAALAAARSSLSSPTQLHRNARSIHSITLLSKRRLSTEPSTAGDIEDAGGAGCSGSSPRKRNRVVESFLHRFRRKRGLSVTDITSTEWCEKQMEYFLLFGKPEISKVMKAGIDRHAVLEEEVVKRVDVRIRTVEDVWALKLTSIGFVEGVWMVGVVDEIRMPVNETKKNPTLVDIKTRAQANLPSEAQRRNGRLQLMCYKNLWDNMVADNFPSRQFFDFFSLNPHCILSEETIAHTCKSGCAAETLDDLMRYFRYTCSTLPPAHEQLLLRYELQEDHSLLGEDEFIHDSDWLKGQLQSTLEFWRGEREAKYAPEEERWKCRFCKFVSVCPANADSISKPSLISPLSTST